MCIAQGHNSEVQTQDLSIRSLMLYHNATTLPKKMKSFSYLTMKSNSAPANIIIPNSVEIAPWTTGENVCSSDVIIRLLREPMAVTKPWNQEKLFLTCDGHIDECMSLLFVLFFSKGFSHVTKYEGSHVEVT